VLATGIRAAADLDRELADFGVVIVPHDILQRCAEDMRERLGRLTPREYLKRHGPLVITREYERPTDMAWDDNSYRGDAYGTYGWACDVAEIEVDRETWEVKPIAFTTVHEIGKAIHPVLALGQIEGGSAQGLGYALLEEVVMRDGRMANAQLTNYIIPTTLDTPPIDVVILENPYKHGPFGAKGVGEMPIDITFLRTDDIPVLCAEGAIDMGITGSDLVLFARRADDTMPSLDQQDLIRGVPMQLGARSVDERDLQNAWPRAVVDDRLEVGVGEADRDLARQFGFLRAREAQR